MQMDNLISAKAQELHAGQLRIISITMFAGMMICVGYVLFMLHGLQAPDGGLHFDFIAVMCLCGMVSVVLMIVPFEIWVRRELTQAAEYWDRYTATALAQYTNPILLNRVGLCDWHALTAEVRKDVEIARGATE